MDVKIPRGKYVMAVSGGVDSMVLLDILAQRPELDLVVAHFNHGIRKDAAKDEKLVLEAANRYELSFESGHGRLGPKTSEESARIARYDFLDKVMKKQHATAIITAHHQDDLIETAFVNLLRGTGRRGMSAIGDNSKVVRPMLDIPKTEIIKYAKANDLLWAEDITNEDESYLRNYIRREIVTNLSQEQRRELLAGLENMSTKNRLINQEIEILSQNIVHDNKIDRGLFINLPPDIANEVMMHFLRSNGIGEFDNKAINRLSVVVKTAKPGTKHDVIRGSQLEMTVPEALLTTTVKA